MNTIQLLGKMDESQADAIESAKQRRFRIIDNLLVKTFDQQLKAHPDLRDDLMHLIDRFVCREMRIAEPDDIGPTDVNIQAFAESVWAAERERCAKLCDSVARNYRDHTDQFRRGAGHCAAAIRAD